MNENREPGFTDILRPWVRLGLYTSGLLALINIFVKEIPLLVMLAPFAVVCIPYIICWAIITIYILWLLLRTIFY